MSRKGNGQNEKCKALRCDNVADLLKHGETELSK